MAEMLQKHLWRHFHFAIEVSEKRQCPQDFKHCFTKNERVKYTQDVYDHRFWSLDSLVFALIKINGAEKEEQCEGNLCLIFLESLDEEFKIQNFPLLL